MSIQRIKHARQRTVIQLELCASTNLLATHDIHVIFSIIIITVKF